MRGLVTPVARVALAVVALTVITNCGDDPSGPEKDGVERGGSGIALATASNGAGLTISTDKDDYAPGDTVWFTGTGWTAGDSLDIVLTDSPTEDRHEWSVGIAADGTFRDSTYVVDTGDLGVSFTLTATSRTNVEQTLTVNFTDGQPQSVTLVPSSRSVPPGSSAAYDAQVTMGGNTDQCTVTLQVTTSLPTGASASFNNNPVTLPAGNTSFNRTLTITTTGATPPGAYPFTVRATRGSNCQGSGTGPTASGTLIVFGSATHLAFGQQPSNTDATASIAPAVTVQVLDANNNLVANSAASIVMDIGTNPAGGTLSGTLTQAAVNGVATFSNLSIDKAGTGYRLAASGSSFTGATSNTFNIAVGAAAKLVFTQQPSGSTPNVAFPTQPTVQVQDAGGNVKTNGTGSGVNIMLSILSGTGTAGATLNCTTNPVAATSGTAGFAGCAINTTGTNYRLRAAATIGGNPFSANSDQFNISPGDVAAPDINCTVPNQSVWYGADVTVSCTASDAGSGLKNASDASFSLHTSVADGNEPANAQTDSRQVCDNNDNCATAGPYTFMVDKKDPTVSCGAADGVWHADNVSIACTASDGGSGLANAADASFSLHTTVAAGSETNHASTGTHVVADAVGNSATAGPVSDNMVDRKAPTFSCGSPDGTWHATDVSIACTAADGGSGLASAGDANFNLSTDVTDGTETNNASTGTKNLSDAVGNTSTAGPIAGNKVDKKAPTFLCGTPDGLWHATDVSIACTAADGGSGLKDVSDANFSLSTNVAAGTETSNASTGTKSLLDAVGNSASAGPISGNKVDKKGPTVNLVCSATVILGSTASGHWTASDGGSGLSGAASGDVTLVTTPVGQHSASVTKQDNVENETTGSCNYNVVFDWTGFFQPVDNTMLNVAKAGSAIPVKFNLGGNQGLAIFTAGSPGSTQVTCDNQEGQDQIEETVTAGGSSLTYDVTAQQYVYVWKTDKAWATKCRRLDVKLIDGTTHSAYFKFKN